MRISKILLPKSQSQLKELKEKLKKLEAEELKKHPKSKITYSNRFGKRSTNLDDLL